MGTLATDLRHAVRMLGQYRGTTAVMLLSVGLAIAGNTTVFSLIEAALFRPLPYPDVDRLAVLLESRRDVPDDESLVSPANFLDWRARSRSFSALEAFRPGTLTLAGGYAPEELATIVATPGLLPLLGVTMERGRPFETADGVTGHSPVAVLSHELWRRRFGGDPKILGSTIRLDGRPHAVVGVLPESFEFLQPHVQVWVPLVLDREEAARDRRDLIAMARLAPGVSIESARLELSAITSSLAREHPEADRGYTAQAKTLREQIPAKSDRRLYALLQSAMLLVLLIACANVANVLLARGEDRRGELAVRTALGAGRWRVARQLLTESMLLALAGGFLGLLIARGAIDCLTRLLADQLPARFAPAASGRVVLFGVAASLGAGLLFGLVPALAATNPNLASWLAAGSRSATHERKRRWIAHGLVVCELAFALTMLSGTALLLKGMIDLRTLSPGFEPDRLLTFRLTPPAARYGAPGESARLLEKTLATLRSIPGVQGATATSILPRSREGNEMPVAIGGERGRATREKEGDRMTVNVVSIPPGYFASLGVPLLAGRDLSLEDRQGSEPAAVLSREASHRLFASLPLTDVPERRIRIAGHPVRVVGIAADVQQGRLLDRGGPPPLAYLPLAQVPSARVHFLLRTEGDPAALGPAVREAIRQIDGDLVVADLQSFRSHVDRQFEGESVIVALMGGFSLVALLLAAVGVYGMMSYSVVRRTRELGIRMALGADRRKVVTLVARRGLALTALGLLSGAPGVWLAWRALVGLLPGAVPVSAAAIPSVVFALAAVASLASLEPANRAAAVDPCDALRL